MGKPRILDLFCGAGGCAKGYQRAGFYVVGVDVKPQPRYCGDEFYEWDALDVLREMVQKGAGRFTLAGTGVGGSRQRFDAIHASPPCQHYANVTAWRGDQGDHPDLVNRTRELLQATGLPWVIENVREAPLTGHVLLCGSMFDLPVRRHRHFETSWGGWTMTQPCQHRLTDLAFEHKQERAYADAMGCTWMSSIEARQAVPPVYTAFIGAQLQEHLRASRRLYGERANKSESPSEGVSG